MARKKSSKKSRLLESFQRNTLRILKDKRLKQVYLARALGIKESTITKWLKGNSEPMAENLWRIADALDVSLDKLVGRKMAGLEVLRKDQMESVARAEALYKVLPGEFDEARDAAQKKQKPAPKAGGEGAKKGKTSKKARKKKTSTE